MNVWYAKGVILAASVVMAVVRAPHGRRSRTIKVVRDEKTALERVVLTLAWLAYLLPLIWIATDVFTFANYTLHPAPLLAGSLCLAAGLWLFRSSHADLGMNWSVSLEVREDHQLITRGVYRVVRHPMYSAFLLYCVGQALVVPNWIVGPSYLLAFSVLLACRLGPEERMMAEVFGDQYVQYAARTKRLIPGIW